MAELSVILTSGLIWICDVSTIGLCVICKIPQIMKIFKTKSVEGLSATSLLLEVLTYAISLSYNVMRGYPLGSYMEDPFLTIQTLIVLLIVYYYESQLNLAKFGMIGAGVAVFWALAMDFPHPAILPLLLTATLPMKVFSKVLQIKEIWVKKSAGNISLVSWIINIYTCLTRIITTALVTGDQTLLAKHTMSVILNCFVIASAWHFRPREAQAAPPKAEDKSKIRKGILKNKNKSD